MQQIFKYKKDILIVLFIILANVYVINLFPSTMFYDSNHYMNLSNLFIKGDEFNLTNYNEPLRGYLFPLIIYSINKLGRYLNIFNQIYFYRLFSIVILTLFNYFILYDFFSDFFKNITKSRLKRLLFTVVINYSWIGLYMYSLSDLWSIIFNIIGLRCLKKEFLKNNSSNYLYTIMSGLFLAGSYYIRPIYLITIIMVIIYLIIKKEFKKILLLMIGIVLIGIPQILINIKNFKIYSFFIPTEIVYGGKSLYLQQLFWGISIQRYETNINYSSFQKAQVIYKDLIGEQILISSNLAEFKTYYEYIIFVFNNMFKILFIYFKHLFNIFDHYFPTVYIQDISKNRILFSCLNYTIWYIFFLEIKNSLIKIKKEKIIYLLIFIFPVLMIIPTALEIRFSIPLYLLAYYIFVENIFEYKKYFTILNLEKYFVFIVLSFTLSILIFGNIVEIGLKNNI